MAFDFIYITAPSAGLAQSIGRTLVEERLAACVNILENMSSLFWWEGRIDEAREAVLIAKTRSDLVPDLIARVKALHSYTVPCVVALRVIEGNPDFLKFLAGETKPRRKHAVSRAKSRAKKTRESVPGRKLRKRSVKSKSRK